jgi:hypothetical protein
MDDEKGRVSCDGVDSGVVGVNNDGQVDIPVGLIAVGVRVVGYSWKVMWDVPIWSTFCKRHLRQFCT